MNVTATPSPDFQVRKIDFNYDNTTPDLWYDNDLFKTVYLATLSAMFPAGEHHFIHSVRLYQNQITDPKLKQQIKSFIGQEAHHSKQHEGLNELMKSKGYGVEKIEKRTEKMMNWLTKAPKSIQLGSTVCSEHFTAILTNYYISYATTEADKLSPEMRSLWAWHCIEETEHKAVAFDVYKQTVNSILLLRVQMFFVTVSFMLNIFYGMFQLFRQKNRQWDFAMWRRGMNYFFGRKGAFRVIMPDYLAFFKKDFHPWKSDNSEKLDQFKKRYFNNSKYRGLFDKIE